MLYLTCTMISSVDLARYGVSNAKDWVSVDYGKVLYKDGFTRRHMLHDMQHVSLCEHSKNIHFMTGICCMQ